MHFFLFSSHIMLGSAYEQACSFPVSLEEWLGRIVNAHRTTAENGSQRRSQSDRRILREARAAPTDLAIRTCKHRSARAHFADFRPFGVLVGDDDHGDRQS